MKKILLLVFLIASLVSYGQPTNYTQINARYNWLSGYFRALTAPAGQTVGLASGQWPGAGALYVDTLGTDSGFYYRGENGVFHKIAKASSIVTNTDSLFGVQDNIASQTRAFDMNDNSFNWYNSSSTQFANGYLWMNSSGGVNLELQYRSGFLSNQRSRFDFTTSSFDIQVNDNSTGGRARVVGNDVFVGLDWSNDTVSSDLTLEDTHAALSHEKKIGLHENTGGTVGNAYLQLDFVNRLYYLGNENKSHLDIYDDSIVLRPYLGVLNIDSLSSETSDTTNYKPVIRNLTTGRVKYLTSWPGGGGASDHGALTGLSDDDHTQYALLAGRSGGQSLNGGTAANDDITIQGTSNATRTSSYVILQPTAGNVGIGTSTPGMKLDIVGGSARADSYLYAGDRSTTYGGYVGVILGDASNHSLLDFWDNGSRVGEFYTDAAGFNFFTDVGKVLSFYTDNDFSAPLIFGSTTQRVGINTASPGYTLHVNGEIATENNLVLKDISAPSTPSSGYGSVFLNGDYPYMKDDGGNVHPMSNRPRVTSSASSATPTPNADTDDQFMLTALATNPTFGSPTGTPYQGQKLVIRIKDDGTPRTLTFNAIYRAGDISLPTTTITSKTMYLGFVYNSTDTKWDLVSKIDNF